MDLQEIISEIKKLSPIEVGLVTEFAHRLHDERIAFYWKVIGRPTTTVIK